MSSPLAPLPLAAANSVPSADASASDVPSASLDTRETTAPVPDDATETTPPDLDETADATAFPADLDDSQRFRHSGWRHTRNRIYHALQRTEQSPSRIRAFCECGKRAWVWESTAGEAVDHRVTCDWCHDRFCEPCGTGRAYAAARKLTEHCEGREVRFLTLTVRGRKGDHLKFLLDRLRKAFSELRETALWGNAVDGGAAFLEIKHEKQWHPHLHCIIEGRYLDQKRLSAAWYAITGDSMIVDIRAIDQQGTRLKYVAKYASKPLDPTVTKTPRWLDEAIVALKGRRMIQSFGSWYGVVSDEDSLDSIASTLGGKAIWRQVGTLPDVWRRAVNGDARMVSILTALRRTVPLATNPQPPPEWDSVNQADLNALF